jgi:hypothetical protein
MRNCRRTARISHAAPRFRTTRISTTLRGTRRRGHASGLASHDYDCSLQSGFCLARRYSAWCSPWCGVTLTFNLVRCRAVDQERKRPDARGSACSYHPRTRRAEKNHQRTGRRSTADGCHYGFTAGSKSSSNEYRRRRWAQLGTLTPPSPSLSCRTNSLRSRSKPQRHGRERIRVSTPAMEVRRCPWFRQNVETES